MKFSSNTMTLNGTEVPFLTHNRLSKIPFINHAFSTRLGGVSENEFTSMNLSFGRGDCDENVTENYKRFCKSAGFDYESLVASAQVHETVVRRVTEKDRGVGIYRPKDMLSVDALITDSLNVTLVTYYADCTPVFFVDTKRKAIGLAHAGWRGTVGNIVGETVKAMNREFGTEADDLVCAVGPVIGVCCYEVSKDCADEFRKLFSEDCKVINKADKPDKFMIDLSLANSLLLQRAGVNSENIIISDLCTKCNSDLLWSHRATQGKRGTMSAFMCLK
ncbi:MAG: peptidoglycan editing factor PgeF [Eubacteriales bacterium]|nr:peptidoglycan editing factor PgeF [Eubacteriales bacterium]